MSFRRALHEGDLLKPRPVECGQIWAAAHRIREAFRYYVSRSVLLPAGDSGILKRVYDSAEPASPDLDATVDVVEEPKDRRAVEPTGAPPRYLGRYAVLEEVGAGGMGRVFRAYDPHLQREVAVKALRRTRAREKDRLRLVAEARAMAQLSHPNVVSVYDVEELDAGEVILVMEFVEGRTLGAWCRTATELDDIIAAYVQAGRGLAVAHRAGLLHRDFKPANALVTRDGETVKVADFGLAQAFAHGRLSHSGLEGDSDDDQDGLTEDGTVIGTPRYMPPEQYEGQELTPAADQYAFCIALWEALVGCDPFSGAGNRKAVLVAKVQGPPAWPDVAVSSAVVEVLKRGLDPDPQRRWPSMDALLEALEPRRERALWTRVLAVGAVAAVSAGGAALYLDREPSPCEGVTRKMDELWTADARAHIASSVEELRRSYGETAWSHTERQLDAYAIAWSGMRKDACEATNVHGEQSSAVMDLRMHCLDDARTSFEEVLSQLRAVDDRLLSQMHEVVASLPLLETCADVDVLRAPGRVPPAADAELVQRTRTVLSRLPPLISSGRFGEARRLLDDARTDVESTRFEPLKVEFTLLHARLLEAEGEYEAAEDAFVLALESAIVVQRHDLAAQVSSRLMSLLGNVQRRPTEALRYEPLGRGFANGQPRELARFERRLASVLSDANQHDEALEAAEHALERYEELYGYTAFELASPLRTLASVRRARGEFEASEAINRRVLEQSQRVLGSEHPGVAAVYNDLASVLSLEGKYEQARAYFERSIEIATNAFSPTHPRTIKGRSNLATLLVLSGNYEEGATELSWVLEQKLKKYGEAHPTVALTRNTLGTLELMNGNHEAARKQHELALKSRLERLGPDHTEVAMSRGNLANVFLAEKRFEDAYREHAEALRIYALEFDVDNPDLARTRSNLAESALKLGRAQEAFDLLEPIYERRQKDDIPREEQISTQVLMAFVRFELATSTQDRARAVTVVQNFLPEIRANKTLRGEYLEEVEAWLDQASGTDAVRKR